jgi:hypothetical protein
VAGTKGSDFVYASILWYKRHLFDPTNEWDTRHYLVVSVTHQSRSFNCSDRHYAHWGSMSNIQPVMSPPCTERNGLPYTSKRLFISQYFCLSAYSALVNQSAAHCNKRTGAFSPNSIFNRCVGSHRENCPY